MLNKKSIKKVTKLHVKVESSNIKHVNYYPLTKKLVVKFLNGSKYRYSNVPNTVFFRLMISESKGRFFNLNIRNKFSFIKLANRIEVKL